MASRGWLIRAILSRLGVYQTGNDLPNEDYAKVDESLDQHLLAAAKLDIYTVADSDNVPDVAATNLAGWLAAQYIDDFGLAGDEAQRLIAKSQEADRNLRYMRAGNPTFARMRPEFF